MRGARGNLCSPVSAFGKMAGNASKGNPASARWRTRTMAYGKDPKSQSPEGESSLCKANARRTSTHFVESLNPPKGNPASASNCRSNCPAGDSLSQSPEGESSLCKLAGATAVVTATSIVSIPRRGIQPLQEDDGEDGLRGERLSQSPEGESSLCKPCEGGDLNPHESSLNPPKGNPASARYTTPTI